MMGRLRAMREPLKYVQGRDALLKFHEEMGYMGKRWLFVCSNSGYKACHDKIEKSFEGLDDYRRYEVFGGISSNGEINKMKAIVEQDNIDTVLAVGGGSAVDTAKATAYYSGKHIVIVPTVAATDAPCTGLSVIYNDDHSFDKYLFYPTNPDAVMVDTTVIANAPVKFLIAGMGDALGTYFEGRASIRTESASLEGTGITRAGQALARLCYDTLREYGTHALMSCSNVGRSSGVTLTCFPSWITFAPLSQMKSRRVRYSSGNRCATASKERPLATVNLIPRRSSSSNTSKKSPGSSFLSLSRVPSMSLAMSFIICIFPRFCSACSFSMALRLCIVL